MCRETGDDWQLTHQLRRRAVHHAVTGGQLSQAALDVQECAELTLRIDEEHAIMETLVIATILCDALGEEAVASRARRSIAMWSLTNRYPAEGYISAAIVPAVGSGFDDLVDGAVPARPMLRTIVDHIGCAGKR